MATEFLSISQLASRLGVSRWTVYSWVEEGRLPHFRLGRQLRFSWAEVEEVLQERRNLPPTRGWKYAKLKAKAAASRSSA